MDISSMKNMIVLKNVPSNLIEEAIVVLKENKKVKKYQYVEKDSRVQNEGDKKEIKTIENSDYIIKEAENVISYYITNLEMKSPKWKNNMKRLEKRYKQSVKLNFILGFVAIIGIVLSFI